MEEYVEVNGYCSQVLIVNVQCWVMWTMRRFSFIIFIFKDGFLVFILL